MWFSYVCTAITNSKNVTDEVKKQTTNKMGKNIQNNRNAIWAENCEITEIAKFIKEKRRGWNEHVQRANNTPLIKILSKKPNAFSQETVD